MIFYMLYIEMVIFIMGYIIYIYVDFYVFNLFIFINL
jgi:hypothetical protein